MRHTTFGKMLRPTNPVHYSANHFQTHGRPSFFGWVFASILNLILNK